MKTSILKKAKRMLSMLLALLTVCSCVPVYVLANDAASAGGSLPFGDVAEGKWYTEGVKFCYANGVVSGVTANTFEPSTNLSRGMFVVMLAAAVDADLTTYAGKTSFKDVKTTSWYANAVEWAYKNGYVSGIGEGYFSPKTDITREQMCVLLTAYMKKNEYTVVLNNGVLNKFTDTSKISSWAKEGVIYAVSAGLMSGTTDTTVSPKVVITRAQATTIMMQFLRNYYYGERCLHSGMSEATCTEYGQCADCGMKSSLPLGHDMDNGRCTRCGYSDTASQCPHSDMTAAAAKKATCTEPGNIDYWHCAECGKYFADANATAGITLEDTVIKALGHTVVIDPAKAPTETETGLTEGSHCSVCNEVIVAQEIVPFLGGYAVTYNIATGNSSMYIAAQDLDSAISNEKRRYLSDKGLTELPELSLDGYQFLGWYNAPPENSNAVQVKEIPVGSVGNYVLYAHWYEYTYDITYKLYQTPLAPITDEKYLTYTVSKGKVDLPNPDLYNYIFLGWYTDDGTEVTEIPAGTTGDITLNAYWTSKRNWTKAVEKLEAPIVLENSDDGVIYFAYEIGTIENVPLSDAIWTIQSVAGLAQQKSETVSTTISQEQATSIAKTISNTTVDSASWTLSNDWNDVTEVSEEWAEQNGMTKEEANTQTKSASGTYSFTASDGGTSTTTNTDGTTTVDYASQNYTHGNSAEFSVKINPTFTTNIHGKGDVLVAGLEMDTTYEFSNEFGASYEQHQETTEHTGTDTTTVDTTVVADSTTWNNSSTASQTKQASESTSVKSALSSIISNTKGYGKSYSTGGENSESQGFSSTDSQSTNSSSTLTYFTSETKTTTTTYSTDGKSEGCYRLVVAGTVHVFAVVGYDVATRSFFAYTYNVLDDKTYEFLDYSPTLNFDDYENGALPFEIPYDVYEYVNHKMAMTDGLLFRTNTTNGTATVAGYIGTDTDITVPSYFTSGNTAYKVVGLSANAFAGKNIRSISLGKYITELPDGAFKNCTELEQISGRFKTIGAEAFSGCTSLENFNISSITTAIGENAFAGVESLYVSALNENSALTRALAKNPAADPETLLAEARAMTQSLVDSAVNSGAQNVILDISEITDGTVLIIDVPEIESFELNGGFKAYDDLKLSSKAATTAIKEITVHNCTRIPLEISSQRLNLDAVSVEGTGFVMLMSAIKPTISLTRDSRLISLEKEAVIWRDPVIISEITDNTIGTMDIIGNVYVCGEIEGLDSIIIDGREIPITNSEFENYIKGVYTITFDANGGNVDVTEKAVFYGLAYGELPIPTQAYHTFDGWFTQDGTPVTAETIMKEPKNITLVAHWTQNDASDWILESELPANAQIVNEKWTYDLTTNITSSSSSVSGYTLYDSKWVWGSYGAWSNWSSVFVEGGETRQVENRTVVDQEAYTNYKYYIYRSKAGYSYGVYNYYGGASHGYCTVYDEINIRYPLPVYNSSLGLYGPFDSAMFAHSYDSYWFYSGSNYVPAVTHTEYRFRDRSKVYTYYHTKTEAKESFSEVSGSDEITNVQKWVQYIAM